eukprot:5803641-Heterocapsa_arctica.AAC.1
MIGARVDPHITPGKTTIFLDPMTQANAYSRTFLWMVRVLGDFRRRSISPATREEERLYARTSSGRQALAKFPGTSWAWNNRRTVSYTHLRAHETRSNL